MAEKLVKYKLLPFGKGHVAPAGVKNLGIWSASGKVEDMILVGSVADGSTMPDGVLEVITAKQWDDQKNGIKTQALKEHKKKLYSEKADPLFIEAYRKKELGDLSKWKEYIKVCKSIDDVDDLPTGI